MAEPTHPAGFRLHRPRPVRAARARRGVRRAAAHRAGLVEPQPRGASGFDDEGYWVVTRHADVVAVSRDSDDLLHARRTPRSSGSGAGMTREQIELQRLILLNIDPPQHTKLRGIVSRGLHAAGDRQPARRR